MIGFCVTVAAMIMTAWIVYAATYRAAYMDGYTAAEKKAGDKYYDGAIAKLNVPAGTLVVPPPSRPMTGYQPVRAPRADCFPPGCNEFPECDHRY
jgi:hypothetical protein